MSTLLSSLGRWAYRHPWRVLIAWLLVLGIAGGGAMFNKGTDNSFAIPGTESQAGLEQLQRTFPQVSGTNAQFIVIAPDGQKIATLKPEIERTIAEMAELDGVLAVTDPFSQTVSGLVSDDGSAAIVQLQFDGQATDVPDATKNDLRAATAALQTELPKGSTVSLGGDLFAVSLPAVTPTELVGLIIALLVLVVTFRSFVVAGLPLLTAVIGVGISLAAIFIATLFAPISATTPLLALMLGLAVGIDYSLFIVSRHQDQVRSGTAPEESAARATGTAGSAVVFAGVTVLIALIGLSFAGIPFLTTMGVAASAAVAIAVAVAVTLTPAMLGFVKGRVRGRLPRTHKPRRHTFSARWVRLVTRHPIVTSVAVVAVLGVAAIPSASLALALPNAGVLPKQDEARQSYDLVADHFGPGFNGPLIVTGTIVTSTDPLTLMDDLGHEIAGLPGVAAVPLATPNQTADTGIVQVIPTTAPDDPRTADLVRELRSHHDQWLKKYGIDVSVTGFTAVAIDISDRLGSALLPFGIFVVGLSFLLLMIVFRSIWVPLKATLGYLLSVLAAFGAVAAVFEWGWLADLLHVSRVGPVISFMPIVLMGVLFGLAMDYEVFLVSRIRETFVHATRLRTPDRATALAAVRSGFSGSARVVTAAALIMVAVFVAFVPEGDSSIKPIALGLAVGIAVDAFLVRMTLTPAILALLGEKAWWFPRWLDRLLPHFDIEGEAVIREKELEHWPAPGSTAAVAAVGLSAGGDADVLFRGVDLELAPDETLLVTGEHADALLLTLAGRLVPQQGTIKVLGRLLPERAGWVRSNVGAALLSPGGDLRHDLRSAFGGHARLVVVTGLDLIPEHEREQATAAIREATRRAARASRPLTVAVSATHRPDLVHDVLRESARDRVVTVDLTPREVNA
ncbi:MMPL family transporter [Microbacterium gorillae]|uniref:MMPL family transporter n=1 Tax=Microbacterium gorillae TaxID=1231063 RepID=UPI00058B99B8|nr:MMPL family transporter [Microbacterium gorillae]